LPVVLDAPDPDECLDAFAPIPFVADRATGRHHPPVVEPDGSNPD
jgi:hypothetical protein